MILVHKGFSCFSVWALKVKVSFSGWSKSFMVWPAVATNLEFVSLLDLPFQLKLFDRCHFFSPLFHGCLSLPLFWPHRTHLAFVSLPLVDLYWPSRVRATWGVLGNLALQLQGRPGQKSSVTKANSKSSSSLLATCKHQIRKHSNGIGRKGGDACGSCSVNINHNN